MKKKNEKEVTWAEIKAMFAENERRFAESRAEFDKRFAESQAEFDKRFAESQAEFDKRFAESQAEADKRFAESQAEADKRKAEADKRQAEADKRRAEADKRRAEADKRFAESQAEADKRKAEADKRGAALDERIDKISKQIGGVEENIGHHAEQFFQDIFSETLTFGGEKYNSIFKNCQRSNKTGGAEIDILLVNGKSVAIIEVKNRIHPKFVREMANEKVANFRQIFPEFQKHKAYLGIAGFSFSQAVRNEAQKLGVGIIKQVGNCVEIDAEHLIAY